MIMEQLDMYMEKINFDPLQKILFKADQSSQYKRQNKKLAEGKWMSLSCVWLFVTPWNAPGQNTRGGSLSLL